jgi:membrane protease YdiL (CAAX protease family)
MVLVGAKIAQAWSGVNPWQGAGGYYLPALICLNVAVVLWAATRSTGWSFAEYLALSRPRGRDFVRGLAYGLVGKIVILLLTFVVVELLLRLWAPVAASPAVRTHLLDGLTMWGMLGYLLWIFITVAVLAPLFEELLYRGLLYRGFAESRMGTTGAILLTALVFGLMHWDPLDHTSGNLVIVVSNILLGLLLGWLRWRGGSTMATTLVHASYNLAQPVLLAVFAATMILRA